MMNSSRLSATLVLTACGLWAAPPLVKTISIGPQPPFLSPQQIATAPGANRIYIFNGPPAATPEIGVVDTVAGLFLTALQPAVGSMTLAGLSDPRHSVSGFAVNAATNRLFAAYTGVSSGALVAIDTTNDSIIGTVNLAGPVVNLALNSATNKLYVMIGGPSGSAQIAVLDGSTLTQTALISGLEPGPMALNAANNKIYAAVPGPSFGVAVINGAADAISTTINMPGDTYDLILNPLTGNVYAKAPFQANTPIYKIDGASDQLASVISSPAAPAAGFGAIFDYTDTTNNRIYSGLAIDGNSDAVSYGLPAFQTAGANLSPNCLITAAAVDFSLGTMYSGCGLDLIPADTTTGTLKSFVAVNSAMNWAQLLVNPANHTVYAMNAGSIAILDPIAHKALIAPFASNAAAVAANPATNQVYIVDGAQNAVIVLDGATNNIAARVPVAVPGPYNIAVNTVTNQFIPTGSSSGVIFNGTSNQPVFGITPNPATVGNIAFTQPHVNEVTNKLYSENFSAVLVTDLNTGQVSFLAPPFLKTGEICTVRGIAVMSSVNRIYAATQCQLASVVMFIYDGVTGNIIQTVDLGANIPTGANVVEIALNPRTNKLYVTNYGGFGVLTGVPVLPSIEVYNAITMTHIASIPNVVGPIAIDTSLNAIYGTTATVAFTGALIDGSTDTLNSTFPLGFAVSSGQGAPIGVNEATHMVYYLNQTGGFIDVFQGTLPAPGIFSIGGQFTGSGAAGVTITAQGGSAFTAVTDANGAFTLTGLPPGAYVVTPSTAGLFCSPQNQSVTVTAANVTGVNFTALSQPVTVQSLTLSPFTTIASGATTNGIVTINQPAPGGGITITLASTNKAGKTPASVTIPAGSTTATFLVQASGVNTPTPATLTATYSGPLAPSPSAATTLLTISPTDSVRVQSATWSRSTQLLKVTASSPNAQAILTLFLASGNVNLGTMTNLGGGSFGIQIPFTSGTPASVNVKSNLGGSSGQGVTILP